SARADFESRRRSRVKTDPPVCHSRVANRKGRATIAVQDQQRDAIRKWPPIGRLAAPATTKSCSPPTISGISGPRTDANDHLTSSRSAAGANWRRARWAKARKWSWRRSLVSGSTPAPKVPWRAKRQAGQTDQLLVLDKPAVQRNTPARCQARRRI